MKPDLTELKPPASSAAVAGDAVLRAPSVPAMYDIVSGSKDKAHGDKDMSSPVPYMTPTVSGLTWVSCRGKMGTRKRSKRELSQPESIEGQLDNRIYRTQPRADSGY